MMTSSNWLVRSSFLVSGPPEPLVKGVSAKFVAEESREVPLDLENSDMPQASYSDTGQPVQAKTQHSKPKHRSKNLEGTLHQSGFSVDNAIQNDETLNIVLVGFGLLLVLSFTISLYLLCKYEIAQIKAALNR